MLDTYARLTYEHHGKELVALLARGEHSARANEKFVSMLQGLLDEGMRRKVVRDDTSSAELASFCLHALAGATSVSSRAAVRRLVALTMAGLQRR